jgi:hypothetical protein
VLLILQAQPTGVLFPESWYDWKPEAEIVLDIVREKVAKVLFLSHPIR